MATRGGILAPHRVHTAFWTLVAIAAGARVLAVFTLNVNWDEFMLLERAVATARTGNLTGGGRPGLATLVLLPFAAACQNAVDALVNARLLWTAIVAAAGAAFWFLLRGVLPSSPHRWAALATGLGLWVLAPPFLRTSTQVRTDQPAILFGLAGGLALMASRGAILWAPVAGLLFGIGFLFSQKLLYVGGLVAVLAVGQVAIDGQWRAGREALRAVLSGAAFLIVVLGYREVTGRLGGTPVILPVSGGLASFEYYREIYGWSLYRQMLPALVPQGIIMASLVLLTLAWPRRRGRHGAELAVAWAVTLVGLGVLFFHAGRFPYFYMVVGLFPATVGALITGAALDRLRTPRRRAAFLVVLWTPLVVLAAGQAEALTSQNQQHQRASLEFVERNFGPKARGYQPHGAFACRRDPNPFPVRHQIAAFFGGGDRLDRAEELMMEFRDRKVAFMVPPFAERYPAEVWRFWGTRYVHYHSAVHVPGRAIEGGPGHSDTFEVLVPGEYVWRTPLSAPLEVAGRRLEPGNVVLLDAQGEYPLRLPDGGEGMLVLALPEPPAPNATRFFDGF